MLPQKGFMENMELTEELSGRKNIQYFEFSLLN